MNRIKRRQLLKIAAAGGLTYAFGRWPGAVQAQVAGGGGFPDYKALVCVFLFGGNDSWSMVVPRSAPEYDVYAQTRQGMALSAAQVAVNPITPVVPPANGGQFSFHPNMGALAQLFNQERAVAVVANVGPLVTPVTLAQYRAGNATLPPQLFSHNDQQDQWHSLKGRALLKTGWAGRVADAFASQTSAQLLPVNISLSGQSLFMEAASTNSYTMGNTGPVAFTGLTGTGINAERKAALQRVIAAQYGTVYERQFAAVYDRALKSADRVTSALASVRSPNPVPFATAFPATSLGNQLKTVAELIAARNTLQVSRQVFFVSTGGFDTHDDQLDDQPTLLGNVSDALAAFYRATVEMGVSQNVTAFTQSDFGRTLTSNGDGTDHAWGGVQVAVGGAVRGGVIYGTYPVLRLNATRAADGADDVGAGRFIPTTSSDQYVASLVRWFGVPQAQLATITPSIGNFAQQDLGILA